MNGSRIVLHQGLYLLSLIGWGQSWCQYLGDWEGRREGGKEQFQAGATSNSIHTIKCYFAPKKNPKTHYVDDCRCCLTKFVMCYLNHYHLSAHNYNLPYVYKNKNISDQYLLSKRFSSLHFILAYLTKLVYGVVKGNLENLGGQMEQ